MTSPSSRLGRLFSAIARPKLSAVMALVFVSFSIPILVFILLFNYHRSSDAIIATLHDRVAATRQATTESAESLIQPVVSTVHLLAAMAASDPALFKTEPSRELLYRALTSADQIDAIYVSFEDGYHRVVTRMDERRRGSDPRIPPSANWHSSYIDAYSAGKNRKRHRTFFDTWPDVVGGYDAPGTTGPWGRDDYRISRVTQTLVVTDLSINPDTGTPVLFVSYPIVRDGRFIGFACANITVDILSRYLNRHRASPHSITAIVERGGTIVAYPDLAKQIRTVDGKPVVARVGDIDDADLQEAYALRAQFMGDDFMFHSTASGREFSASFDRFPASFPRPWETVILTPSYDFVGPLRTANRQTVAVIALLTVLELLLIYALSTRLSRPIEGVSRQLRSMETLSFEHPPVQESHARVREIAQLQEAVSRVRASLRSFARYAPEEVVREVAASGHETALTADRRDVTALFSDLRGFTTVSERLGPERVVAVLNEHFEALAGLIASHGGYVVDFLGDGLFAVFGAPEALPDHAARAVACAIEMQRAREAQNRDFFARQWPPLEMGIGINTGPAVVGNMGSSLRTKYGVVGHPVNLAARIESFTVGGQVLISDSTRDALGGRVVADGPLLAEAKGVAEPVRMWMVRRFVDGGTSLDLPSPAADLVALSSPIEVTLRPLHGKQIGAETYAGRLVKLSAAGGLLATECPLEIFDDVHLSLPAQAGLPAAIDGKVLDVTEGAAGRRAVFVRFSGLDWDARSRMDALARLG